MHVLITGAAGIVGSSTLVYFLEQGHTVIALDIAPLPDNVLNELPPGSEVRVSHKVVDLRDITALEAVFESASPPLDGVVHIGGIPNPLNNDPRFVYNTNVTTNYNILQTCAKYRIKRIVQASSVNAYGLSFTPPGHKFFDELPMNESSPAFPEDPYATSKICCEIQASAICRYYPELRVASLRYHMCKPTYQSASEACRPPSLWGWVSLESCARAALLGLTSEGWSGHEIFILASQEICWEGGLQLEERFNGERHDSLALLESNWKGRYGKVDKSWWAGRPRRGFWDCSKARDVLGWEHEDNV